MVLKELNLFSTVSTLVFNSFYFGVEGVVVLKELIFKSLYL